MLFNWFSQITFISEKARNKLNLKTDDKQNISVKSFRRNENIQEIDRAQFFIKENAGENLIFVYH